MSNKWHPIGLNPARSQILNISTNSQKLNLAGACSEPYPKSNCGDDESQFLDLDSTRPSQMDNSTGIYIKHYNG